MKTYLKILLLLIAIFGMSSHADAAVSVKGYYRKDGTYVAPYKKTNPDQSKTNNWSTKGNINPYTGTKGTVDPFKTEIKLPKLPSAKVSELSIAKQGTSGNATNTGVQTFADGSKLNWDTGEIIPPSAKTQTYLCNSKVWLDCDKSEEFFCPLNGDPVCRIKQSQVDNAAQHRIVEEGQKKEAILVDKLQRLAAEKSRFEQRTKEIDQKIDAVIDETIAEQSQLSSSLRTQTSVTRNQPIAQTFITGQQASEERQLIARIQTLTAQMQSSIAILQKQQIQLEAEYRRSVQLIINE